ncbi:hypothetical protein ARMGADRAFT_55710 [Armillaria gallica]|uniref:Uncharacterized protein n=1 Tax=Armillaria gallica TaxID=47427 RepID=A0A2H3EE61_ARMGA|nr:hypothetical protein ARMGADRAFT_55710 [Armillaria gallica]
MNNNIMAWLFKVGFPHLSDDISIAIVGVTSWIAPGFVARRKSYKAGRRAYTMFSLYRKWRCGMSPQSECYVCFRSLMPTTLARLRTASCDNFTVSAANT